MAKLYPPNINGTIPAFYSDINGTTIVVPFSMNRAVSLSEIEGMELKIKSLNGTLIGVRSSSFINDIEMTATFDMTEFQSSFLIGNYYKIQLAYIQKTNQEVGYFSTVGVIKYTALPSVSIAGLESSRTNLNKYEYTGVYYQEKDPTEKLYSYKFTVYDGNIVFYTTDEKLHNNINDDERNQSIETFKLPIELEPDKYYTIQFVITTSNQLEVKTPRYKIVQRKSVDPSITAELVASLNFENGYITLTLDDNVDSAISGSFIISRCSNINNYSWEKIKDFTLSSIPPSKFYFKDFTIEQGVLYRYSIQQYNNTNGIYSNRIISNEIEADFEDAFLYDGERQLKIRFNPKVSSFKVDLQESKQDTIGYQYPFFSRNSSIYYKEFPISGLISYLMDENELFITKDEIGIEYIESNSTIQKELNVMAWTRNRKEQRYNTTTQLTSRNISAERAFKMNVLKWLNNGKPKSFRSPGEGNYLVRLMNVSLSPNDTLGRMLHTFSCTAYEIADYTLDNLAYYGIYDPIKTVSDERRWSTFDLINDESIQSILALRNSPDDWDTVDTWVVIKDNLEMQEIFVEDMLPGSQIMIDDEIITIGSTGSYRAQNELSPFTRIAVNKNSLGEGLITYGFNARVADSFSNINDVVVSNIPCQQIIGNYHDGRFIENILDELVTVNSSILKINYLRVIKRPLIDGVIQTDLSLNEVRTILRTQVGLDRLKFLTPTGEELSLIKYPDDENKPFELPLYQLRLNRQDFREQYTEFDVLGFGDQYPTRHYIYEELKPYTFEQYYIDKHRDRFEPYVGYFYDPYSGRVFAAGGNMFHFSIDDEDINVTEIETWEVKDLSTQIQSICINEGLYAEITYSQQTTHYVFDSTKESVSYNPTLNSIRENYENTYATYLLAREGLTSRDGFTDSLQYYIYDNLPLAGQHLKVDQQVFDNNIISAKIEFENADLGITDQSNTSNYYRYYHGNPGNGIQKGINALKDMVLSNQKTYLEELEQVLIEYGEEKESK